MYFNENFRDEQGMSARAAATAKSERVEWAQGFLLDYQSGFTQGTVGVGVDAHSLSSIKIDSGRGKYGNGLFDQTSDGRGDDTQTEVGGAVKFRVSDTVLKYGQQFVASPVFATDDSRLLPEVATGTLITSKEIKGLELNAGRFTAESRKSDEGRDSGGLKSINVLGGSYQFTENFKGALYASDVEDVLKKQYINLNYNLPLAEDQALNFDFNIYRTKYDTGSVAALDYGGDGKTDAR